MGVRTRGGVRGTGNRIPSGVVGARARLGVAGTRVIIVVSSCVRMRPSTGVRRITLDASTVVASNYVLCNLLRPVKRYCYSRVKLKTSALLDGASPRTTFNVQQLQIHLV